MSANSVVSGVTLRSIAALWREELGKSDRDRLDVLLDLAADRDRIRMADCLAALFPDMETRKAQTALTALRKRLNDAAEGEGHADLGLRFHVDMRKQSPPTNRFCWFTGPDPAVMQAERYSEQITADVKGMPFVPSQGIATTGTAMASGKRAIRFFASYAHDNRTLFEGLMKELSIQFAASARYELIAWMDRDILVGERWKESIEKAIKDCDFGLMMISPAFFASGFIKAHELPRFVGDPENPKLKPVLPVGLVPVTFGRHDLQGLGEHQFFLFRNERIEGRYYDQMPAGPRRREFARQLHLEIEKRLDAFFFDSSPRIAPLDTRARGTQP